MEGGLPDYMTPGVGNGSARLLFSAVIGVLLCVGVAWLGAGASGAPRAPPTRSPRPRPRAARRRRRSLARKTADSLSRAITDVLENEELAAGRDCCNGSTPA